MNIVGRPLLPLCFAVLFLGACARLPHLKPVEPAQKSVMRAECQMPFLPAKYRLVHTLEADLSDGKKGVAIGVLIADPLTRTFRSMLMTLEGWVMFDIEAGEVLTVRRALPPFDSPAFAKQLAEDIGLAFFSPAGEAVAWGRDSDGVPVCRYGRSDGGNVDIMQSEGGMMEIRLYGAGQDLRKGVKFKALDKPGLADEIVIWSSGFPSYTLRLKLVESEAILPEPGRTP
jgi:hypothetical protein